MSQSTAPSGAARYGKATPDERIMCELCPRRCRLRPGQRGACYVRRNTDGELVLTSYGQVSGLCIDPIEKKPLYHFLPGTTVLSFGSVGCHLACRFCQNWHLSNARDDAHLTVAADPDDIAAAARRHECAGVAFTYNDPIPSLEYVVDVAASCREQGIRTVAVTNGYILPEPRREFFDHMDAANVDLKAFTDAFYRRNCAATLQPVLDTLMYIRQRSATWLELTNLIIPGENDSEEEFDAMTRWIVEHLGPDTPVHFSAFRPAWRMMSKPATSSPSLLTARRIGLGNGLRHVYTGNIRERDSSSTRCAACGSVLVERAGFTARRTGLEPDGRCRRCGDRLAGVF